MGDIVVRSISSSRVHALNNHNRRVELTPWDLQLLMSGTLQAGLIFKKPRNDIFSCIKNLKTSLSQTLTFFPTLAGRLSRTDNYDSATASFFIDCNNVGAQFDHAKAESVSLSDILDADYVPTFLTSFFLLKGTTNHEGINLPLLAVQATELADGVFLGCTANHVAVDGTSFWHFLNSWSEMARGLDTVSRPPVLKPWFASGCECPVRIPLEQLVVNKDDQVGLVEGGPSPVGRVYRFEKEAIAELKAKANSEAGTERISSLQALLTHLWRCVTRAQGVEHDADVFFGVPVGVRSRVQPSLPEEYFGNAAVLGLLNLKAGDLVSHREIGHAALEMNKTIGLQTHEMIETNFKSWSKNPKLLIASKIRRLMKNLIVATNSPRFKVYDIDMGWGRPIGVRCCSTEMVVGQLVMFPGGYLDDGSIEVHAYLLPRTFEALHKDREFTDKLIV